MAVYSLSVDLIIYNMTVNDFLHDYQVRKLLAKSTKKTILGRDSTKCWCLNCKKTNAHKIVANTD